MPNSDFAKRREEKRAYLTIWLAFCDVRAGVRCLVSRAPVVLRQFLWNQWDMPPTGVVAGVNKLSSKSPNILNNTVHNRIDV